MLEQIVAKALETEKEASSRIALAQDQCSIEENNENKISQKIIPEYENDLRQDLFKAIEIQEKDNKEKLQSYIYQQEEELKSFLTKHHTKIQKVSQNICDLICTPILLESGNNSPNV